MAINKVHQRVKQFVVETERKLKTVNEFVGETFVKNARQSVTDSVYNRKPDRQPWELTGNLRNSIGYGVRSQQSVSILDGGGEGGNNAKHAINEADVNDNALIMVAGMSYAGAVEARGYDVISNSVNIAIDQHKSLIKKSLRV